MIILFYIVAVILVILSYRSYRGGARYLAFFERELTTPSRSYTPFATVIVPLKGLDDGLKENLEALALQNYPDYELLFVVDDPTDPAAAVAAELESRVSARVIVAPPALECSQKVENLREGVLHGSMQSEVFVFADSDVRPAKNWLPSLVAPLANDHVGAATGYRWFISNDSFASALCSTWNASIASALGANERTNFCWGGSMAVRRSVFEELDMRRRWRGALSDDFAMTSAIIEAAMSIVFVPQALTPSIERFTFDRLLEFTTRQMKITRVYAPHLWANSMLGSTLFCLTVIFALVIVLDPDFRPFQRFAAAGTIVATSIFSIAKAYLRLRAAAKVIAAIDADIRRHALTHLTLWSLTPFLFLFNCIAAALSREIVWRGVKYRMISASKTIRIVN